MLGKPVYYHTKWPVSNLLRRFKYVTMQIKLPMLNRIGGEGGWGGEEEHDILLFGPKR